MAEETSLATQDPEVVREQIDGTRSAITEKLEALEDQVRETMMTAKESVTETIESVKSTVEGTVESVKTSVQDTVDSMKTTVQDTVETVKRSLDIERHVNEHPWAMLGGSVLAGCVVGAFIEDAIGPLTPGPSPRPAWDAQALRSPSPEAQSAPAQPRLLAVFDDEIKQIKGMAIGYLLGLVRDYAKEKLPQLKPQIDELMESATTKLGGTV